MNTYPFYIKATIILLAIVLLGFILAHAGQILIPLSFAFLVAILLNPIYNWLLAHRIPPVPAIILCLLLAFLVMGGLAYFIISQLSFFTAQLPLIQEKSALLVEELQMKVQQEMGVDIAKQDVWLAEAQSQLKYLVGSALDCLSAFGTIVVLLPVYVFLIFYYKSLLLSFIFDVFSRKRSRDIAKILAETKLAVQQYMVGLLLESLVVAILDSGALLIIGVEYAILLGVLGALLNLLPYIGNIIAVCIPVFMVTVTEDGYDKQIWIILSYMVIQFIDNNILIPYVVSSKVKINALISILGVWIGGAMWGISGMFLSIPFLGILKIIFDHVPSLKPCGKLLGDKVPRRHPFRRR